MSARPSLILPFMPSPVAHDDPASSPCDGDHDPPSWTVGRLLKGLGLAALSAAVGGGSVLALASSGRHLSIQLFGGSRAPSEVLVAIVLAACAAHGVLVPAAWARRPDGAPTPFRARALALLLTQLLLVPACALAAAAVAAPLDARVDWDGPAPVCVAVAAVVLQPLLAVAVAERTLLRLP